MQSHPGNPGKLAMADLAGYQPLRREPICSDYRASSKDYQICGMPPPSSRAITIPQILGILTKTDAAKLPLALDMGSVTGSSGDTPSAD